jgi:hypothetical protein
MAEKLDVQQGTLALIPPRSPQPSPIDYLENALYPSVLLII